MGGGGENVEENGGCGKEEDEEVNNYARYHSLWTIHNYLSNPLQVSAEITPAAHDAIIFF